MKTNLNKVFSLLTATVFTVSLNSFAQGKKANDKEKKMHIKIEIEKDGKTTKVDTTINAEDLDKLNEQLKDLDVNIGSLEGLPEPGDAQAFKFEFDEKKFEGQMKDAEERMKEAEEAMKDQEFDMKDLDKHLKEMEKNIKDKCKAYMFEFSGDSAMQLNMEELQKEMENMPGNMNFNFNYGGDGKAIIINSDSDNEGSASDSGEKKIKIRKMGKGDGKSIIINSDTDDNAKTTGGKTIIIRNAEKGDGESKKNKKEEKKVIIIMKTSSVPEKKRAEFAAEPVKDEKEIKAAEESDEKRVRVVGEKESNSWLNNFTCYPNPSSGEFTLRFQLTNPEPAEVKIVDLAGREVFSEKLSDNSQLVEKQIKLPSNSSSAYLLILRQGNNWLHEKIFVRS